MPKEKKRTKSCAALRKEHSRDEQRVRHGLFFQGGIDGCNGHIHTLSRSKRAVSDIGHGGTRKHGEPSVSPR